MTTQGYCPRARLKWPSRFPDLSPSLWASPSEPCPSILPLPGTILTKQKAQAWDSLVTNRQVVAFVVFWTCSTDWNNKGTAIANTEVQHKEYLLFQTFPVSTGHFKLIFISYLDCGVVRLVKIVFWWQGYLHSVIFGCNIWENDSWKTHVKRLSFHTRTRGNLSSLFCALFLEFLFHVLWNQHPKKREEAEPTS